MSEQQLYVAALPRACICALCGRDVLDSVERTGSVPVLTCCIRAWNAACVDLGRKPETFADIEYAKTSAIATIRSERDALLAAMRSAMLAKTPEGAVEMLEPKPEKLGFFPALFTAAVLAIVFLSPVAWLLYLTWRWWEYIDSPW